MSNTPTNAHVFKQLEGLAPKDKAYDWDNVGLQIGSYDEKTNKIMITLDVLESVVDEAIKKNANLIIAHHPLLFKPLKHINTQTPEGRIISKLIRHDITVYAAHTNLDVVASGVNDMLADQLELQNTTPLITLGSEKLYKYAVHVPESHISQLKRVIGDAGGGHQGDYTHCSFEIQGTGSFTPLDGADPYIGEVGKLTKVEESKIEVLVKESQLQKVIRAVAKSHPYEEPAFDIIELTNKGERYGLGRIGKLAASYSLDQYAEQVKTKLSLSNVRVVGDLKKEISKVAIVGGSGEKYMHQARNAGADVYITGDVGFHQAQAAMEMGLAVIDAGHYIEQIMKENVKVYLQRELADFDVEIISSKINTDPFKYI